MERCEKVGMPFIHKKTGNVYFLLNKVLDCTNARDGNRMCLYMNWEGQQFVRDEEEFFEKFEALAGKVKGFIMSQPDNNRWSTVLLAPSSDGTNENTLINN